MAAQVEPRYPYPFTSQFSESELVAYIGNYDMYLLAMTPKEDPNNGWIVLTEGTLSAHRDDMGRRITQPRPREIRVQRIDGEWKILNVKVSTVGVVDEIDADREAFEKMLELLNASKHGVGDALERLG